MFDERNRRREDTIKAIEDAIAKLQQRDFDPSLLDKATALNDGYTGPMIPKRATASRRPESGSKKPWDSCAVSDLTCRMLMVSIRGGSQ